MTPFRGGDRVPGLMATFGMHGAGDQLGQCRRQGPVGGW